ncbi:Crp/Fnr family transcriptional regulator [Limibacter armeniacum]|uniref:Crp/Fnr family transcriptional regulator n=1 Tax=Limibacter armeniacum TaxID=466084 RepID=UPI002FE69B1D
MECLSCLNHNCLIKKSLPLSSELENDISIKGIKCRKGQTFILEGSPVYGLYFIRSGKVKVSVMGYQGKEQILRFAGNGDVVGHRGYGAGEVYKINATTMEDSTICHVPNQVLNLFFESNNTLAYNLMRFYSEELDRSETKVRNLAQMNVKEKVIDTLLHINRKFGQRHGFIDLEMSRKEIADYAGTTDEQVIRIISALKKEALLTAKGKKIGIPNVELLKNEINKHHFYSER